MVDKAHAMEHESKVSNVSWIKRLSLKGILFFIAVAMFCVWQIAFVIFSLFLGIPELLPELWVWFKYDGMPLHYFLLAVSLILLPTLCVGVIVWLIAGGKKQRTSLVLKFFYGFELPALFILSLYLINMRDYGFGMYWLLLNVGVALLFWCVLVISQRNNGSHSNALFFANSPIAMAGSSIVFAVGAFVSIGVLLFIIPAVSFLAMGIIEGIIRFDWSSLSFSAFWSQVTSVDWVELLFSWNTLIIIPLLAGITLGLTSTVLIAILPFALIYLYIGQFLIRIRQARTVSHTVVAVLVLALLSGVHFFSNIQPQQSTFALLEHEPQSEQEKHEQIDQAAAIREGLMNAYLGRYRYLSSVESADILTALYSHVFLLETEKASVAQKLLNVLFKPLIYDGDLRDDVEKAEKLYEQHFDIPIQKAELDEIWRSVEFNAQSSAQNAAGLLDVSQKSIHLASQSIDIEVVDQLATVRITQKLVNKKQRQQEAVMHFSLPSSTVATGVWLSNDEKNLEQHTGLVAPKGAAQEVYNREVSRRIDPALLEKVGPDLYRLRVYPILAARRDSEMTVIDGEPMFVTLEYQTLAGKQGAWPMPTLLEKRHLYWDSATVVTVNGVAVERINHDDWIPKQAGVMTQAVQAVTEIPADFGRSVWAVPRSYYQTAVSDNVTSRAMQNMVVLVDGSRSMQRFSAEVVAAVNQVGAAKVYFCTQSCVGTSPTELAKRVFWGNSKPINQLEAFLSDGPIQSIDGIVMLTDDGSYETELDTQDVVNTPAPVWVLHVGEARPYAYADAWLTTVNQSGGGFVVGDMQEFIQRHTLLNGSRKVQLQGNEVEKLVDHQLVGISDDWLWFDGMTGVDNASLQTYAKLGAAMDINRATKTGETLDLDQLDFLHRQAIQANIVTELSSMIVLVNDVQKKALEDATNKDDRFDRENETGAQMVSAPEDTLAVAAVPEPHEWALLLIVMLFVTMSLYRRRQEQVLLHQQSQSVAGEFRA